MLVLLDNLSPYWWAPTQVGRSGCGTHCLTLADVQMEPAKISVTVGRRQPGATTHGGPQEHFSAETSLSAEEVLFNRKKNTAEKKDTF